MIKKKKKILLKTATVSASQDGITFSHVYLNICISKISFNFEIQIVLREFSGEIVMLYILTGEAVTWVYTFVKSHETSILGICRFYCM